MKLILMLFAACLVAQGVWADGHITEDTCKDWYGDGGCDGSCLFPGHRCCISEEPVCIKGCQYDYCVKDPEFCIKKLEKVCKIVPKKICDFKTVCNKVKKEVCKVVNEKKCVDVKDEVCEFVDKCETKPKCDWVDDCSSGGSVARGSAFARGDDFASASSSASAGFGFADATADAESDGIAKTDTFASVGGGCRRRQVCNDDKHCYKDKVCKPIFKKVCKDHPVKKCFFDWVDDCVKKPFCDWVDKEVCDFVEVEICKDPVKCYDKFCDPWFTCNPLCCPIKKIPICIAVKTPVIAVKPVHG